MEERSSRDSWEAEYRARGRLWGGVVRSLPDLSPGSRVLDLGCGDGKLLEATRGCGWALTALDFSENAAQLCKKKSLSSVSALVTGNARALPFRHNAFDAVLAFHVIGHLDRKDRRTAAREIFRVLIPGGQLFFSGFSRFDLRYARGMMVEEASYMRGNGIVTHYFSRDEIVGLFSELDPVSVSFHEWTMQVRGKNLRRSEVYGVFTKK